MKWQHWKLVESANIWVVFVCLFFCCFFYFIFYSFDVVIVIIFVLFLVLYFILLWAEHEALIVQILTCFLYKALIVQMVPLRSFDSADGSFDPLSALRSSHDVRGRVLPINSDVVWLPIDFQTSHTSVHQAISIFIATCQVKHVKRGMVLRALIVMHTFTVTGC